MPFTPRRIGSVASSLVMFLLVSVLCGVLIAGLFVPFAGLAGVSSKAAAEEMSNLPTELATPAPWLRSRVVMGNGKTLAYFYDENRIPVKLSKIAPVMRQAQIAIEDHRFYEHGALDFKGTFRALVRNSASEGGQTQGGSSITQQYVKMVQVEACQSKPTEDKRTACAKDAQEPTLERKIRELRYAVAMENKFTKDQILEKYLNIAYYGDQAYGIEAAARHYFDVKASKLTLPQAAMLAGLVQNPDSNNPVRNLSAALDRRDVVLNRMASPQVKVITEAQAKEAKKVKFDSKNVKLARNGCLGTKFPFLCDYVYRTLLKTPSLGKDETERANMVKRGGLTIETAIDPTSQKLAEKKVLSVVGPKDPIISTMNMIQPGTGLIIASAQSRPVMGGNVKEGETFYNMSTDLGMGGREGFQAGSTFKPFTMAAALDRGIPISKKFNARSPYDFSGKSFDSCEGREQIYGRYVVKNSVGHSRTIAMTEAAEFSVNTYFVQLELATGMCRVTKMAEKLGVQLGDPKIDLVDFYQHVPSFTLGTAEVSPMSMAESYATFASRGIHCDPIILSNITNQAGKDLAVPDANCKRVISKDVADGINKILKSVMDNGTGKRAKIANGYQMAGKTGTTDSNAAVWFAGYTPEIAAVSMIAADNRSKPFKNKARKGIKGYRVPSTGFYLEGSGSGDAGAKIWTPVMAEYLKDLPKTTFQQPSSKILRGKRVTVPSLFGLSYAEAKKKLEKAGFTVENQYVYSDRPKGTGLGWSPSPGTSTAQFSTINYNISKGRDPAVVAAERQARADAAVVAAERQARADAAVVAAERQARADAADAAAKARADAAAKKKAEADAKKKAAADAKKKKPKGG